MILIYFVTLFEFIYNRVNYSIHLYDKYIRRLSSESAKTIEYIMKRNLLMIQMDDAFFLYLIYLFTHSRRNEK